MFALFTLVALVLAQPVVPTGRTQSAGHPAWLLPGAREKVADMDALAMRSRVVMRAAPDVPWELKATFGFPDRARVFLATLDEHHTGRTLRYRFGELAPFLAPLQTSSVVLEGEERLDSLRRLELRRAVVIWPHGFEWQGAGATRRADLGELGTLIARLGDGARPESVECRLADGEVRFALEAIQWKERSEPGAPKARARLLAMIFVERGVALWDETVETVDPGFNCIDRFFLPPDRREYVAERADLGRPEPATMPRGTWRRTALAPGADWRVARARAEELARAATAELAPKVLALEPSTTFELSDSGRPVAVLLQLEEALDDPPEGWRTLPARPGAQVMLRSVRQVRYETLQALRRTAGGGTAAPLMVVPEAGSPDRSVAVFIAAKSTR